MYEYQTLRKQEYYDGCIILDPDEEILCRTSRKKIDWYLSRKLATIHAYNPLTIKLNFQPKGIGNRGKQYELSEKSNHCVVCGGKGSLTRHHIVPIIFRRHFPRNIKEHNDYDVLLLCTECHSKYEPLAHELHKVICDKYGLTFHKIVNSQTKLLLKVSRHAHTLLNYSDKMPEDRRQFLINRITNIVGEPYDLESLAKIRERDIYRKDPSTYGEKVVNHPDMNIQELTKMWRTHFVESMNPQFMSPLWKIDNEVS